MRKSEYVINDNRTNVSKELFPINVCNDCHITPSIIKQEYYVNRYYLRCPRCGKGSCSSFKLETAILRWNNLNGEKLNEKKKGIVRRELHY